MAKMSGRRGLGWLLGEGFVAGLGEVWSDLEGELGDFEVEA